MLLPALEGFSHQGIRLSKQPLLILFSAASSLRYRKVAPNTKAHR